MESVKNTVYTNWHLVNLGEKEQLIELTANRLNESAMAILPLAHNEDYKYRHFILELLSTQKLVSTNESDSLVLQGLRVMEDPIFKKTDL